MIEVKLSGKDSQTSYSLQLLEARRFPIVSRDVVSFVRTFHDEFDDVDRYHIKATSVQNFREKAAESGIWNLADNPERRLYVEISDVAILMLLKMIYH